MSKTFTNQEVFGKQKLQEYGVKGMKWGQRKSGAVGQMTPAGKIYHKSLTATVSKGSRRTSSSSSAATIRAKYDRFEKNYKFQHGGLKGIEYSPTANRLAGQMRRALKGGK